MSRLSPSALASLQPLLDELQQVPGLDQIKPGFFYCKRLPMLHFHEVEQGTSGASIVADVKCVVPVPSGFDRIPLTSAADRKRLIAEVTARCQLLTTKCTTKSI